MLKTQCKISGILLVAAFILRRRRRTLCKRWRFYESKNITDQQERVDMNNYYVLIVTGDNTYKENTLQEAFKRDLQVEYVKTMEEALNSLLDKDYVLVVIRADTVDYLPLINVMKRLKPMPVLVFSYVEPTEKIQAYTGADVYITSPFALDYIIESSYALAHLYDNPNDSYTTRQPEFLTYEYVRVCVDSRQVFVRGKEIDIKRKEFDVLCLLMRNRGKVLAYAEIFRQLWGDEYIDNSVNTLSSVIHRLKKKLSVEPGTKKYIKNIHQVGYSFDPS